jgi:hypothetical protein
VNEKALKDRKYQSARNWIRTKLRYVVGARRKQKAAQILRIVPNRNNYKIALF